MVISLKAKLPVLAAPGYKVKKIVEIKRHGDVALYGLVDELGEPRAMIFALVNGVLIAVCAIYQLAAYADRIPTTEAGLVEAFRQNTRASPSASHRLVWEALDLPPEEWSARYEELIARNQARETERAEAEQTQREQVEATEQARHEHLIAEILASREISGPDLLELARLVRVQVAPGTSGMIRKRVQRIDPTRATMIGKGRIDAAFALYAQVQAVVRSFVPQ